MMCVCMYDAHTLCMYELILLAKDITEMFFAAYGESGR